MTENNPPIYKVGVVLRRAGGEVLIIRPIPKNPGEPTKWVLPRGSRQYRDAGGIWHDARDAATALAHADALEPLRATLNREAMEEAGVDLASVPVTELGTRLFDSATKPPYPIHWFVARVDSVALATPKDALETHWATLDAIRALGADFSVGYLPVIEEALSVTMHA